MTEKEYNNCVSNFADNLYRFLLKSLRNSEDAKDIVQSSFEKLWKNRDTVVLETVKSYLFTIGYNLMIDHIRKYSRVDYKETLPEKSTELKSSISTKRMLEEALSKLNDVQRSLVLLKDYEGYSYAEISEITELNESQVKVYLHRARLQLRSYIVHPENIV